MIKFDAIITISPIKAAANMYGLINPYMFAAKGSLSFIEFSNLTSKTNATKVTADQLTIPNNICYPINAVLKNLS